MDLDAIARRVPHLLDLPIEQVWSKGKYWHIVAARSLVCFWAVRELGMSANDLAKKFDIFATAVSNPVLRAEFIAQENGFRLEAS